MIPFIIIGSFKVGSLLTGTPMALLPKEQKALMSFISQHLLQYLVGSFALATFCAGSLAMVLYLFLKIKHKRK
jgi:glycosyltransferase, family 2